MIISTKRVFVCDYHYIDWHCFQLSLEELKSRDADWTCCTKSEAEVAFKCAGWEGDGDLDLIWIPPFMLVEGDTYGMVLWHVKQGNNGTSWLLASRPFKIADSSQTSGWVAVDLHTELSAVKVTANTKKRSKS